jgi:hypothetical protein
MDGYPKTLYPRVGGGSIEVASPEQEKRLGEGWVHHPPFVQTNFVGAIDVPESMRIPKRRGRPKKELPSQETIS